MFPLHDNDKKTFNSPFKEVFNSSDYSCLLIKMKVQCICLIFLQTKLTSPNPNLHLKYTLSALLFLERCEIVWKVSVMPLYIELIMRIPYDAPMGYVY